MAAPITQLALWLGASESSRWTFRAGDAEAEFIHRRQRECSSKECLSGDRPLGARKKAAESYFDEVFGNQLAALRAQDDNGERAQKIAHMFRFICPSPYLLSKHQ